MLSFLTGQNSASQMFFINFISEQHKSGENLEIHIHLQMYTVLICLHPHCRIGCPEKYLNGRMSLSNHQLGFQLLQTGAYYVLDATYVIGFAFQSQSRDTNVSRFIPFWTSGHYPLFAL